MTYTIVIPTAMRDLIGSWGLSFEAEDHFYSILELGLTGDALKVCPQLPAPSPTFLFDFGFRDPLVPGDTLKKLFNK